jgi:hypothetical protein
MCQNNNEFILVVVDFMYWCVWQLQKGHDAMEKNPDCQVTELRDPPRKDATQKRGYPTWCAGMHTSSASEDWVKLQRAPTPDLCVVTITSGGVGGNIEKKTGLFRQSSKPARVLMPITLNSNGY